MDGRSIEHDNLNSPKRIFTFVVHSPSLGYLRGSARRASRDVNDWLPEIALGADWSHFIAAQDGTLHWGTVAQALEGSPFLREVGIDSLAEPGFLLAPAQSLLLQDLKDARSLYANTQDLLYIGRQPLEGPTAEGQA